MNKTVLLASTLVFCLCATLPAHASGILLNFAGLKDTEPVENFYNGGVGGFGSTKGLNYGITFSSNTLAIKSYLQGGSGSFVQTPVGTPGIFFTGTTPGVMNSNAGFTNGVNFYYVAGTTVTVAVWSGSNGTGSVLATITLFPNSGGGCGANYCSWTPIGLSFVGSGKSLSFSGPANLLGISDITVGSSQTAIPEPSSFLLLGTGIVGLYGRLRRRQPQS
jgi:hypothetical protein